MIAVDAMGGDHAPEVPVQAALEAARDGLAVALVGDAARIDGLLTALGGGRPTSLTVTHAPDVIEMTERPSKVRSKPHASIRVAARMVAHGEATALVSAGNSGAVMGAGLIEAGTVEGVQRPALTGVFPTRAAPVAVLDLGANVDPTPLQLAQFAVMGEAYASTVLGRARPKVAILANGSEEVKGNDRTRAAHALLEQSDLDYAGYCEGGDVFAGGLDVIVTDGFTGNVVLKTVEGLAKAVQELVRDRLQTDLLAGAGALLMKDLLRELKSRFDYEGAGAAPLLGLNADLLVAHGASNANALKSAIRTAEALVRHGVRDRLAQRMADHAGLWTRA